jgi:hypothetical protein
MCSSTLPHVLCHQLFSPNGFFARLLASGRLPYILLAAALIPIGIYLSVLYFLLYHDYRQGCVTHRQTEGTRPRLIRMGIRGTI